MDSDKKLEFLRGLEKLKASKIKAEDYSSPLDQDVMKVKSVAEKIEEPVSKLKGMTQKIDTKGIAPVISGEDFSKKIAALRAAKAGGKKLMGALPFVGAGIAALQGDPAMAAEEIVEDVTGPAGMLLKSEGAGMSPEDEKQMIQEIKARENYDKSPARMDKLKKLLNREK